MSKVAVVKCENYEIDEVLRAVNYGFKLLGGASKFAKKGSKVLLKPNMLCADSPDKCATTHPAIFYAVAQNFLKIGAIVSYGDSPGIGSTVRVSKKTGMYDAASKLGLKLADFKTGKKIRHDKGIQNKQFFIANAVLENDVIVSLPKLKSHGLQKYSGAVKNQFGCIPGVLKAEYHVKIPDVFDFAKMLLDLNSFVNPRLYIMDAVFAMEGNGPRGGTPREMNVILMSADPVALDAVACKLINLDPNLVPTISLGSKLGFGQGNLNKVKIVGDNFELFYKNDFIVDREPLQPFVSKGLFKWFKNWLVPKPIIDKDKCINCGICFNVCPACPKAIIWSKSKENVPKFDYDNCIRCFCCQEMCPESVISLKKSFIRKIIRL